MDGNPLLSTAPWRFLLPDAHPVKVVTIGDGPAAEVGRTLQLEDSGDRGTQADLVVVDTPCVADLRLARGLLHPGGTLYVEWRGLAAWRPGRASRQLRAAGFDGARLYVCSPSRSDWQITWWIPLGSRGPTEFVRHNHLGELRRQASLRGRVRFAAVRLAGSGFLSRRHPGVLSPARPAVLSAVAWRGGAGHGPPPSGAAGLLSSPRATGHALEWDQFLLRVGGTANYRPMGVILSAGTAHADTIVKLPVYADEQDEAHREAAVLRQLRAAGVSGVPAVRALESSAGHVALAQTALPGHRLSAAISPASLVAHAEACTAWLIQLGTATANPRPTTPTAQVDALVAELEATAPDEQARRTLAAAKQRLRFNRPLPAVVQHGDFGPWNILVDNSTLGVVDWGGATTHGIPLVDLVHVLPHLTLCAFDGYGPDAAATVMRVADPLTTTGRAFAACVRRYAHALGLRESEIRALRTLTWLLDVSRQPHEQRWTGLYADLLRLEADT